MHAPRTYVGINTYTVYAKAKCAASSYVLDCVKFIRARKHMKKRNESGRGERNERRPPPARRDARRQRVRPRPASTRPRLDGNRGEMENAAEICETFYAARPNASGKYALRAIPRARRAVLKTLPAARAGIHVECNREGEGGGMYTYTSRTVARIPRRKKKIFNY